MYIIMTCDIIRSRQLTNRVDIQEKLKATIKKINHDYQAQLKLPFVIVWGDSFQGALKSIGSIYEIYESFKDNISIDFRCGVGIGNISTKPSDNILEMDGEAFTNSRFSLKVAKRYRMNIWIRSNNKSLNKMMNVLFVLLDLLTQQLSPIQRETIALRKQGLTYEEIGKKRGVSKQAVFNILKAAKWTEISLAKRLLASLDISDFSDNKTATIPISNINWEETKKMTGYQFQHWISQKFGIISLRATGDGGLEGILDTGVPCQIKKGMVGVATLRDFVTVLNDLESKNGLVIGQEFSPSARKYCDFKRKKQQLDIQLIEIRHLNKSLRLY